MTERLLRECPAVQAWASRMDSVGYGDSRPISPAEALAEARQAEPAFADGEDPGDPLGLKLGSIVAIFPISDTGEKPITGELVASSRDTVSLRYSARECGTVSLHFPRVGYRMMTVEA